MFELGFASPRLLTREPQQPGYSRITAKPELRNPGLFRRFRPTSDMSSVRMFVLPYDYSNGKVRPDATFEGKPAFEVGRAIATQHVHVEGVLRTT